MPEQLVVRERTTGYPCDFPVFISKSFSHQNVADKLFNNYGAIHDLGLRSAFYFGSVYKSPPGGLL